MNAPTEVAQGLREALDAESVTAERREDGGAQINIRLRDREGREPDAFHAALSTEVGGTEPHRSEFKASITLTSFQRQLVRGSVVTAQLVDMDGEVLAAVELIVAGVGMEDKSDGDGGAWSVRVHKLKAV